jgi:hypothetical protein
MRIGRSARTSLAFSCWDFLALGAMFVVGAGLILPWLAKSSCKGRSPRIQCVSNLKQIGIAFRMWSNDHQEQFPMAVPVSLGGSLGVADSNVFQHFLTVSNELNSPKILACPEDLDRKRASTWTNFSNSNLSYFVGLDANEQAPASILTGDRNICGGTAVNEYLMVFTNWSQAGFTGSIHKEAGNICLADGSASQWTSAGLVKAFENANMPSMRFAIPGIDLTPRGLVRSRLLIIGFWCVISVVVVVAGLITYLRLARAMVARAETG